MTDDIIIASKHEAEDRAERIRTALSVSWDLIKDAWRSFDWQALEYPSWDAYCDGEFGTSRIRLPREERREVVSSMREIGMSTRAISSATGVSKDTVRREIATGANAPVGDVTGVNGKTYTQPDRPRATAIPQSELDALNTPPEPEDDPEPPEWEQVAQLPSSAVEQMKQDKPRRSPITDDANRIGWEIRKATEKLDRLTEDDRWSQNTEKVTPLLRGHLQEAINTYTRILAELEGK